LCDGDITYYLPLLPMEATTTGRLKAILNEKCPRCRKGRVFEKKIKLFQFPVMKKACDECGYKFDREPGYFLGAMYISYGLAVLQGLIAFLICHYFFPDLPTIWIPVIIMCVIVIFSMKNYKLSRIIYMHIFPW
jgi:uncharacterized protein (DUF983 family)